VDVGQRVEQAADDVADHRQRQGGAGEAGEADAVDELGGQVEHALDLAGVDGARDVGMIEQLADVRLGEEHVAEAHLVGELGANELERDIDRAPALAQPRVEYFAHAADADATQDLEAGETNDGARPRHGRSVAR
jgi:hypothetical protein